MEVNRNRACSLHSFIFEQYKIIGMPHLLHFTLVPFHQSGGWCVISYGSKNLCTESGSDLWGWIMSVLTVEREQHSWFLLFWWLHCIATMTLSEYWVAAPKGVQDLVFVSLCVSIIWSTQKLVSCVLLFFKDTYLICKYCWFSNIELIPESIVRGVWMKLMEYMWFCCMAQHSLLEFT